MLFFIFLPSYYLSQFQDKQQMNTFLQLSYRRNHVASNQPLTRNQAKSIFKPYQANVHVISTSRGKKRREISDSSISLSMSAGDILVKKNKREATQSSTRQTTKINHLLKIPQQPPTIHKQIENFDQAKAVAKPYVKLENHSDSSFLSDCSLSLTKIHKNVSQDQSPKLTSREKKNSSEKKNVKLRLEDRQQLFQDVRYFEQNNENEKKNDGKSMNSSSFDKNKQSGIFNKRQGDEQLNQENIRNRIRQIDQKIRNYQIQKNRLKYFLRKDKQLNDSDQKELNFSTKECPCCGKLISKLCFRCEHVFCKVQNCPRKKKQMLNARMLERMKVNKKEEQIDELELPITKRTRLEEKKKRKNREEIQSIENSLEEESFEQESSQQIPIRAKTRTQDRKLTEKVKLQISSSNEGSEQNYDKKLLYFESD